MDTNCNSPLDLIDSELAMLRYRLSRITDPGLLDTLIQERRLQRARQTSGGSANPRRSYVIGLYHVELGYGGAEEGGWWYQTGRLIRMIKIYRSETVALEYCQRLNKHLSSRRYGPNAGKREMSSVLSDGEYCAQMHDDIAPQYYPETRPRYE